MLVFQGPSTLPLDSESVLAVITHKGGVAKGLAHNHFIHAEGWQGSLEIQGDLPSMISISLPVDQLVVDEPALSKEWYPRINALGLLEESFSDVSEKDRGKIRKSMLSKKQLDGEHFEMIEAALVRIEASPGKQGDISFSHSMEVALTIRGVTHTVVFKTQVTQSNDQWLIDGVGEANFTDFGFEPYSAMFGAVSNKDLFHVIVHLVAKKP